MHFQLLFKRVNTAITILLNFTTATCVAAWSLWGKIPVLWAILICTSQAIQAIFPKLPYNDILISTKFMISALEKLLLSIRFDWLSIDVNNLSDNEIQKLLKKHQTQYSNLVEQFFSGEYLPIIKYCERKANTDTKNYFSNTYSI